MANFSGVLLKDHLTQPSHFAYEKSLVNPFMCEKTKVKLLNAKDDFVLTTLSQNLKKKFLVFPPLSDFWPQLYWLGVVGY